MKYLLATLSGVLVWLTLSPAGMWPLVFICWTPLLVALNGQRATRRLALGALAGAVAAASADAYLWVGLQELRGIGPTGAALFFAAHVAWASVPMAVFAWAYGPLRRYGGAGGWLWTAPLLWSVLERVHPGVLPLPGWAPLAAVPALMQSLEWVGPSGLTVLVWLPQTALAQAIELQARGRATDHFAPTAVAALWLLLSVYGVVRMGEIWSAPIGRRPTIAVVAAPVPPSPRSWWEEQFRQSRAAAALEPDLLVWPQPPPQPAYIYSVAEGRQPASDPPTRVMFRRVRELGVPLASGGTVGDGDAQVTAAVIFRPGAHGPELMATSGTGWPERLLHRSSTPPDAPLFSAPAAPRSSHAVLDGGLTVSATLGLEALRPELGASPRSGDPDLLVALSAAGWMGVKGNRRMVMALVARAIENRRWIVRAALGGPSAFVDPTGTVRATSPPAGQAILAMEVSIPVLKRGFYGRRGDVAWLAMVALGALSLGFRGSRNFRQRALSDRSQEEPEATA